LPPDYAIRFRYIDAAIDFATLLIFIYADSPFRRYAIILPPCRHAAMPFRLPRHYAISLMPLFS
jgi:hypothetical protein